MLRLVFLEAVTPEYFNLDKSITGARLKYRIIGIDSLTYDDVISTSWLDVASQRPNVKGFLGS